jgi:superfamily II DNA or RNA helicase
VAATGTGKTVIAALDYRRLRERWPDASLLFVAHRKEFLTQSRRMFRTVLRDGTFGEMYSTGPALSGGDMCSRRSSRSPPSAPRRSTPANSTS